MAKHKTYPEKNYRPDAIRDVGSALANVKLALSEDVGDQARAYLRTARDQLAGSVSVLKET